MKVFTNDKTRFFFAALLLIALSLAVFGQVLGFSFLNYDDDIYVTANPQIAEGFTWQAFKWAWLADLTYDSPGVDYWQPLSVFSRMLDIEIFGFNAAGHHFTNLLLHTANALLIFFFLLRATSSFLPSFFVACLFVVHPLQVDTVAWVTARKDVLCTFFGFISLISYDLYVKNKIPHPNPLPKGEGINSHFPRPEGERGRVRGNLRLVYALSVLFFALSLMSKPALAALPVLFLILDVWLYGRFDPESLRAPKERGNPRPEIAWFDRAHHPELVEGSAPINMPRNDRFKAILKLIAEKWPFYILAILSLLTLVKGRSSAVDSAFFYFTLVKIPIFYVRYLYYFFHPVNLLIRYPEISQPLWMAADAAVILAGITYFAARLFKKLPYLLAGWLWFLAILTPSVALDFENRYMYVPMIGLSVALSWGLFHFFKKFRVSKAIRVLACSGLVAGMAMMSQVSASAWKNSFKLFGEVLNVDEKNPRALNNYATALVDMGRFDEAEAAFTKAIWMWPDYAEAHNNLGVTLMRQGKDRVALTHMKIALNIKPDYDKAFNNLSILARRMGELDRAIQYAQNAIRLAPQLLEGRYNLAVALADKGLYDGAIQHLNYLLRQSPKDAEALSALGFVYDKKGEYEKAEKYHQAAIRLDPTFEEAYKNLGDVYLHMGRMEDALREYERAAVISPLYAEAQNNAAVLLAGLNRHEEAIAHLNQALAADPDYTEARQNLRLVLSKEK